MEIIGLIVSVVVIILSLIIYFKHDKKIKEQSRILNEYNIEKINNEKLEAKKAIIEAYVIPAEKGNRIIKVYNKGKAVARNVTVSLAELKGISVYKNPSPFDIRPQNSVELKLSKSLEGPTEIDLTLEWTDDFKENNKDIQAVQL
jgi:hypothetical protein